MWGAVKLLKASESLPKSVPSSELLAVLKGLRQKLITHAVKDCRCATLCACVCFAHVPPDTGEGKTLPGKIHFGKNFVRNFGTVFLPGF